MKRIKKNLNVSYEEDEQSLHESDDVEEMELQEDENSITKSVQTIINKLSLSSKNANLINEEWFDLVRASDLQSYCEASGHLNKWSINLKVNQFQRMVQQLATYVSPQNPSLLMHICGIEWGIVKSFEANKMAHLYSLVEAMVLTDNLYDCEKFAAALCYGVKSYESSKLVLYTIIEQSILILNERIDELMKEMRDKKMVKIV